MANLYDLKKFDLNLLVIFECIYQHLSISKAAETLFITPSAVSQSLQRLRNQINDPLFIRSGKGITPTTVGINLHLHLEQNLNQIEQTINMMNMPGLKKKIHIFCPQILTPHNILNPVLSLMEEYNYTVELQDVLLSGESAEDLLAYRKADLIFNFTPIENHSVVCTHFKTMKFIYVCRNDHPRLGESATIEEMQNEKFTQLISDKPGVREFHAIADRVMPNRNIAFRSDSFISLISIISSSNLIGILPESTYEQYRHTMNIRKFDTPIELPTANLYMLYNKTALNSEIFEHFIKSVIN